MNLSPYTLAPADMLWLGNQQSAREIQHRLYLLSQGVLPKDMGGYIITDDPEDGDEDEGEDKTECDTPRTYYTELKGGLAIVTTQGPLTQDNSFMSWLLGGTTYNQIRAGFLEAASLVQQGHAREILHIVKSGGGQTNGLEETGALIRQIATQVCPVTSYGNLMCSAAYWLAMAASKVYAPASADLGNIGTRMTIPNYFKELQDEGVTVHVITAGKYKALGDPTQPWSKEAEDYLQSRVDDINDIFLGYVAEYRDKNLTHVTEKMAQGREFTGKQAYDVGLIDGVVTLDVLVQKMQAALARKPRKPPSARAPDLAALPGGGDAGTRE
jgi:signal peptide peptidase SppA